MVIDDDVQPTKKSKKKFPNSNFRLLVFHFQFKTKGSIDTTSSPKLGPRWPQLQECGSLGT